MQKRKLYCRKIMYAILSAAAMLLLPVGSYAQPDGITLGTVVKRTELYNELIANVI